MGNIERGNIARYEYMLVRYYNLFNCSDAECLEDIPETSKFVLSLIDYKDLIRPLVIMDLHNGMSFNACARRYGITKNTVQWIRERFGVDLR